MGKGTVLVVEDNEINQEIAVFLLKQAGFATVSAEDADEGIRLAKSSNPDLILMDIHLPGKDGYEAAHILKSIPQFLNVPIIAFTALAMPEDHKRALAHGCDGIICKPIDIDSFANTVESHIHQSKTSAILEAKMPEANGFSNDIIIDREKKEINRLIHDIKTHMVAEFTVLQVFLSGKIGSLTSQQRAFLEDIIQSNQQLSGLIENWTMKYFSK
jgi:CheY-like chemotaxis protein